MRIAVTILLLAVAAGTAVTSAAPQESPQNGPLDAQAVQQADREFARALKNRDKAAFRRFLAPDAIFFGGEATHRGPEAILEAWSRYFEPDGPRLEWEPVKAEVNGPAGLATTTGPFRLILPTGSPDRDPRELRGTYFSVWRLESSGKWRVIFDTGTSPVEEPGPVKSTE